MAGVRTHVGLLYRKPDGGAGPRLLPFWAWDVFLLGRRHHDLRLVPQPDPRLDLPARPSADAMATNPEDEQRPATNCLALVPPSAQLSGDRPPGGPPSAAQCSTEVAATGTKTRTTPRDRAIDKPDRVRRVSTKRELSLSTGAVPKSDWDSTSAAGAMENRWETTCRDALAGPAGMYPVRMALDPCGHSPMVSVVGTQAFPAVAAPRLSRLSRLHARRGSTAGSTHGQSRIH